MINSGRLRINCISFLDFIVTPSEVLGGVLHFLLLIKLNYKLDGTFVTGPIEEPSCEQYEVSSKTLTMVTNQPTFKLQDLNHVTFLVFRQGCRYRTMLEKWLEDEEVINNKFMEFNMLEMILHSVFFGLGITILLVTVVDSYSSMTNISCHEITYGFQKITTIFNCNILNRKDLFTAMFNIKSHKEKFQIN
ncbi:TPA: hypothetical protein QCX53_005619 [Bacillus cereus]|nr:hypothetical protein [Bacillus cereus]